MTIARHQLIQLDATHSYHIYNRCVRRAFLCGFDKASNKNYQHRKQWIINEIAKLQHTFCIQIAAYAIMSNHYHLIVHINQQQAMALSPQQVVERWAMCRHLPDIIQRWRQLSEIEQANDNISLAIIKQWQQRLFSISWFMRLLNQHIAYKANQEDQCTGRFWEGRFKSQALLDDNALLQAMAYVDLNPIRAGLANTPEQSDFTSAQQRIQQINKQANALTSKSKPTIDLLPLQTTNHQQASFSLPIDTPGYIALIDWTGRAIDEHKRGYIPSDIPPILMRMEFKPQTWIRSCAIQNTGYYHAKGKLVNLKKYAALIGQDFVHGIRANKLLFEP